MKRSLFFLSFFFIFNFINVIAIEIKINERKPLSLYASYFIFKEFFKGYIHSLFIDENKIEKAQIACCQCNMTVNMSNLWGYAINEIDKPMITKIILLLYNGSKEEITTYLLSMHKEHHIECYACQKYNDWYIVESGTV